MRISDWSSDVCSSDLHYIAARFNGPSDAFNHFAQDANFNRGTYRAMEDAWAASVRAGHRVMVDIVPHYDGLSLRPDRIKITWFVDGEKRSRTFETEHRSKRRRSEEHTSELQSLMRISYA